MAQQFSRAKAENKPVLLYWGATWCPPLISSRPRCSTARTSSSSPSFVAVGLDGDAPGAQKLGERFKVRGYRR